MTFQEYLVTASFHVTCPCILLLHWLLTCLSYSAAPHGSLSPSLPPSPPPPPSPPAPSPGKFSSNWITGRKWLSLGPVHLCNPERGVWARVRASWPAASCSKDPWKNQVCNSGLMGPRQSNFFSRGRVTSSRQPDISPMTHQLGSSDSVDLGLIWQVT